jgi:uncharacterized protein YutE (UPF0331/DUF86 family)
MVDAQRSSTVMSQALEKFLQGMAAAVHLLNKAIERRSALECIVLEGNLADGCLRMALILKSQLDSRSNVIDDSLLIQRDSDPKVTERMIYARCLQAGVIDQSLFDALSAAYDKRNKCIHRYLLSDIDYDYATNLVFELHSIRDRVTATVDSLEKKQIHLGVGMSALGPPITEEFLKDFAAEKEKRYNL